MRRGLLDDDDVLITYAQLCADWLVRLKVQHLCRCETSLLLIKKLGEAEVLFGLGHLHNLDALRLFIISSELIKFGLLLSRDVSIQVKHKVAPMVFEFSAQQLYLVIVADYSVLMIMPCVVILGELLVDLVQALPEARLQIRARVVGETHKMLTL